MATPRASMGDNRGFSLTELVISMAVMTVVMSGVLSVMLDATRINDSVKLQTQTNNNLRVAMDLLVRDLLQAGQGLPTGRVIGIPSGPSANDIRRPGPLDNPAAPATVVDTFDGDLVALPALTSGPDLGPDVAGEPTDTITMLAADSAFEGVQLTALTSTAMTVVPSVQISDNPD
ncbi:MAG TPA: prepilin-type N-terminal cleavage/methylation domain-containing protein, partial [Luteitalea sp.]|nr:prepilin-type N-terminal cleavage/methylation domain-containing protein [Luteitalea sp.]